MTHHGASEWRVATRHYRGLERTYGNIGMILNDVLTLLITSSPHHPITSSPHHFLNEIPIPAPGYQ